MVNVEVRKNKEGYELNFNTLIYSELLMNNVRFLVTNQICRILGAPDKPCGVGRADANPKLLLNDT